MLVAHINMLASSLGISRTGLNYSNTLFGLTISIVGLLLLRPNPQIGLSTLLRSDLDIFFGYPRLDLLKQRLRVVARRLPDPFLGLCDATNTLLDGTIDVKDFNAPLRL